MNLPTTTAVTLLLSLAFLPVAAPAAAVEAHLLYKCVGPGGTSIQSRPCPAGATTAWKRPAPPDAAPTPEASALADARKRHDQQEVRELSRQVEKIQQAAEAGATQPQDPDDDVALPPAAAVVAAPAVPPAQADPDLQACQDAQAFANAAREKEWLGLSEDQIRRLYGWVATQCKVPSAG